MHTHASTISKWAYFLISDGDCKKRWKYIRDSYNRFKRKRKMATGSSAPPKNSKWEFFKRLQFLELVATERPTASNIDLDSEVPSTLNSPAYAQFQTENSDGCPNEGSQSPKPPPPRRRRIKTNDGILDYLMKRDESRQMTMKQLSANTYTDIDDEITSFGNHMMAVLRKLHPRLKIQAKNDIYYTLNKYEMIQMDLQETTSVTSEMSNPSTSELSAYSPISTASTPEATTIQTQCTTNNDDTYYVCDVISN